MTLDNTAWSNPMDHRIFWISPLFTKTLKIWKFFLSYGEAGLYPWIQVFLGPGLALREVLDFISNPVTWLRGAGLGQLAPISQVWFAPERAASWSDQAPVKDSGIPSDKGFFELEKFNRQQT